MKADAIVVAVVATLAVYATVTWAQNADQRAGNTAPPAATLKAASDFDTITDQRNRSVALFEEAGKVLQHPRCLNCHPVERAPTQGDDMHPHVPEVAGGPDNHGMPGMPCNSCHGKANSMTLGDTVRSIPGDGHWALAPASMAWQGKSLGQICEQLKDLQRNGNRDLAKISRHMADDTLVGWAWHPGAGRQPAPGTQEQFGALINAWIATGAACPKG
ncbi:Isoquinoline 1-oxidoreductase subunit [Lysobacter panacisoli]|uniref:Isoquinoline 1-oxidoreductase subunit n=1 Tax=Lysobacter panacisoli TaxID=1255263 RepID=A0ABP9LCW6_9GAMM|nr:Isoquinoline 1-oxidoreductase subunit [Lysobacter panacisoli]